MDNNKHTLFGELDPTDLSNTIYNILLNIKTTLTLPTHATLVKSTGIALGILVSSLVSYMLDFPTAIEPISAMICFVTLLALSILEGGEENEILRMYTAAELSARKALRRAKEAGARISDGRGTNDSRRNKQKTRRTIQRQSDTERESD